MAMTSSLSQSFRHSPLTFSATDEDSLMRSVSSALQENFDLNLGVKRCFAIPAVNEPTFLFEILTKESWSILSRLIGSVSNRCFVDHEVIHLMYVPTILSTTRASCKLMLKHMGTQESLKYDQELDLSKAFVITMRWPRSVFASDARDHRGLYLGGVISCEIPRGQKIGMWYPFWTEKMTSKQLYQKSSKFNVAKVAEMNARSIIKSNREMRVLMKNYISMENSVEREQDMVKCDSSIDLLKDESDSKRSDERVDETPGSDKNRSGKCDILVIKKPGLFVSAKGPSA
uniref:Movement protein n=1 Tax=Apple ilarvirus 1 TaxID=2709741 RepID=A0A6C0X1C2_9BROM|nr:MAG: movement protein [Apple ilarvirus 1]